MLIQAEGSKHRVGNDASWQRKNAEVKTSILMQENLGSNCPLGTCKQTKKKNRLHRLVYGCQVWVCIPPF